MSQRKSDATQQLCQLPGNNQNHRKFAGLLDVTAATTPVTEENLQLRSTHQLRSYCCEIGDILLKAINKLLMQC